MYRMIFRFGTVVHEVTVPQNLPKKPPNPLFLDFV